MVGRVDVEMPVDFKTQRQTFASQEYLQMNARSQLLLILHVLLSI